MNSAQLSGTFDMSCYDFSYYAMSYYNSMSYYDMSYYDMSNYDILEMLEGKKDKPKKRGSA